VEGRDAPLSQQIFNEWSGTPAMAEVEVEVETIVESDGVSDDIGRESMAPISIHLLILPISAT
jgi:hypothetical protein